MKREILFRGKTLPSKKITSYRWIYGSLFGRDNCYAIIESGNIVLSQLFKNAVPQVHGARFSTNVCPETVCQFTGLIAKKCKLNLDNRIFEKDIFRHTKETDKGDIVGYSVVVWLEKYAAYYLIPAEHYNILNDDIAGEDEFAWLFDEALLRDFSIDVGLTKVGNVFDNPELING